MKRISSTIRWDTERKRRQVDAIARRHNASINKLVNHWADTVIAQEAAEAGFRAAAANGDPAKVLALLDKLDADDEKRGIRNTQP